LHKLYIQLNRKDSIEKLLLKGITTVKEHDELYPLLAEHYMDLAEYDKAADVYKIILQSDSSNQKVYETIMDIYADKSQYQDILNLYNKYKDIIKSRKADILAAKAFSITGDVESFNSIINSMPIEEIDDSELLTMLAENCLSMNEKDKAKEIAQKIKDKGLDSPIVHAFDLESDNNMGLLLLDLKQADVNGDGKKENILLMGKTEPDFYGFTEDIHLMLQDGDTGHIIRDDILDFSGYPGDIFVGDFTGDRIPEVKVSIHSGGTSGAEMHYIYSYLNNEKTELALSIDNGPIFSFIEGYKVRISNPETKQAYIVNLSEEQKRVYIENNFQYEPSSYLAYFRNNILNPIDSDGDGIYELKHETHLVFSANYNADFIAGVESLFVWTDSGWSCKEFKVEPLNDTDEVVNSQFNFRDYIGNGMLDTATIGLGFHVDFVINTYGQPAEKDVYEGSTYYSYPDKHIIFFISLYDDLVSAIGINEGGELFGVRIGMTCDEIKDILGSPDIEGYDEMEGDYFMLYQSGIHQLYFFSPDKNSPTDSAMLK